MNIERLLQAESDFLYRYPLGFNDPEMLAIAKKHKMEKMIEHTQSSFSSTAFANTEAVIDNWIKTVSRSSMVSVFEKPKFKGMMNSLSPKAKQQMADGLYEQLHGKEEKGFNLILDILVENKLAKWSLMTIVPAYFSPKKAVFVKPTTAKGVIAHFELDGLTYKPRPSWAFYRDYKKAINQMKRKVDRNLSGSNAAFSGFLMMSMPR
jgi:hypothetical protein